MDNMKIYSASAKVPQEAIKSIEGGRLKGMSDINPMWRIKKLTELFGPCGFGWKYVIRSERLEKGVDEVSAFVTIDLYVKQDGEWSEAIPGLGGSSFLAKERNGIYQSDECFKMALTDAIGVACKALGFAADVYYAKDRSKHDQAKDKESSDTPKQETKPVQQSTPQDTPKPQNAPSEAQIKRIFALMKASGKTEGNVKSYMYEHFEKLSTKELTIDQYNKLCGWLEGK